MGTAVWFAIIGLFIGQASYAQSECSGELSSYQSLLKCAEARSPEVLSAQLVLERAKAQSKAAAQWQNPELSAQTFQGKVGNDNRKETDFGLGLPIELGGKISARKGVAQGEIETAEAKLYEARAKVRAQTFLKLQRLLQLRHEQGVIDEAVGTYSKLLNQYSRRLKLSPEQEMSSSVFRLSKNDYELKKLQTVDELLSLETYFKVVLGLQASDLQKVQPANLKSWPPLRSESALEKSPQLKILQAEVNTSQAELSLAQSGAWPTLTIGPSVKLLEEAGVSSQLIGMNLSMQLPVFNLNNGAKAAASSGVKLSETRKQLGLIELSQKREELLKIYNNSVKVLGASLSSAEIEKRHEDVERLFNRGIIPSSLVIEVHRTSYELEISRHERELKTFEALFDIYILDGVALEVEL